MATLRRQAVELVGGDVLLVRTGSVGGPSASRQAVREALGADGGEAFAGAGPEPSEAVTESLCDQAGRRDRTPTTRRWRPRRSTPPAEETWLRSA